MSPGDPVLIHQAPNIVPNERSADDLAFNDDWRFRGQMSIDTI